MYVCLFRSEILKLVFYALGGKQNFPVMPHYIHWKCNLRFLFHLFDESLEPPYSIFFQVIFGILISKISRFYKDIYLDICMKVTNEQQNLKIVYETPTGTRNPRMAPDIELLKIKETRIQLPTSINLGQVLTVAYGQPSGKNYGCQRFLEIIETVPLTKMWVHKLGVSFNCDMWSATCHVNHHQKDSCGSTIQHWDSH